MLAIGACAVVLLTARSSPGAASAENCRAFHRECTEAKAAGYRDVGICHVERLVCPGDRDAGVPQRPDGRDDDGNGPGGSVGERR